MSSHLSVVYDACMLYPAPLRDLLMRLALSALFRARWTEMIHHEWLRNAQAGAESNQLTDAGWIPLWGCASRGNNQTIVVCCS